MSDIFGVPYLSEAVAQTLHVLCNARRAWEEAEALVYIGGHPIPAMASPENFYFPEVNITGISYIALNNVVVFLDPNKHIFTFFFEFAGKMEA